MTQPNKVDRTSLLDVIDDQLQTGGQVLRIQGQAGDGKSFLAEAYYQRHRERAVLLQVSTASAYAYDPELLMMSICEQATSITSVGSNASAETFTHAALQKLYAKLSRLGTSRKPIVMIVDGLHAIPDSDKHIVQRILDLIPFGLPGIQIVITDLIPTRVNTIRSASWLPWRLPRFTVHETLLYLQPIVGDEQVRAQLHHLVNGRPASLASIVRLLGSGTRSPADLLTRSPRELKALLAEEWALLEPVSQEELIIFALITVARTPLTTVDVCRIAQIGESTLHGLLERCRFIKVESASSVLLVDGDNMREFVMEKTRPVHRSAYDALIADLMKTPNSKEGIASLPRYFREAGRWPELLDYLNPTRIMSALDKAESTDSITGMLSEGLLAARRLAKDGESYRFALQKATVSEISQASTWEANVAALIALGQTEAAIHLAESVVLASERLMLLARIASKSAGLPCEQDLVDRIRRLLGDVRGRLQAEECVDLAGLLLAVLPEEAIGLLRQSAQRAKPGLSVDWAIALVALRSLQRERSPESSRGAQAGIEARVVSTIRDPDFEKVTGIMVMSVKSLTADDVIARLNEIKQVTDQIFFMSMWLQGNHERADAVRVTEIWLKSSLIASEHLPNARDVLLAARPLEGADWTPAKETVKGLVEGTLKHLAEVGPSVEYLQIKLLLAASNFVQDVAAAQRRLVETYFEVAGQSDLAVRTEALARALAVVCRVRRAVKDWRDAEGLEATIRDDVGANADALLRSTAEHDDVLRPVVEALGSDNWQLSMELIRRANTPLRRDELRVELVKQLARAAGASGRAAATEEVIRSCEGGRAVAECCKKWWKQLKGVEVFDAADSVGLEFMLRTARDLPIAKDRAIVCALAYKACAPIAMMRNSVMALADAAVAALNGISDSFDCIESCLMAAKEVSAGSVELGMKCLAIADSVRKERLGGRAVARELGLAPIRLALAAYAGLLPQRLHAAADSDRLLRLIGDIPSPLARCEMWSTLASWSYVAQNIEECRTIVNTKIVPELQRLKEIGDAELAACVIAAADSIFVTRAATAEQFLSQLNQEDRDEALNRAVTLVLDRVPWSEPRRREGRTLVGLKPDEVDDLVLLVKGARSDALAYWVVERITDAVNEKSQQHWTQYQRTATASMLKKIGDATLPRPGWIQHKGYRILWRACCERLAIGKKLKSQGAGEGAISSVDNVSDRCHVGAVVSEWMSGDAGRRVLSEAADAARSIPVATEKIERLAQVATTAIRVDPAMGRELAVEVMRLAQGCDRGDMESVQRHVMDSAYRHNKEMAGAIAESLDRDPVRSGAKSRIESGFAKKRLDEMATRQRVVEGDGSEEVAVEDLDKLPQACWDSLAGLNAGVREPKRMEALRKYVAAAAGMPLSRAYPVLAWIVANARVAYERTPHAALMLRPLFEAAMLGAEFAAASTFVALAPWRTSRDSIVEIGEAELARSRIGMWLDENLGDRLIVIDPYFGPKEVWLFLLAKRSRATVRVTVLTGVKEEGEDAYRREWRKLSEEDPPWAEIISVAMVSNGACPLHDRWILADASGMKIGSSLNGLGFRVSQLAVMPDAEFREVRDMIEPYANRVIRRLDNGSEVRFSSFVL